MRRISPVFVFALMALVAGCGGSGGEAAPSTTAIDDSPITTMIDDAPTTDPDADDDAETATETTVLESTDPDSTDPTTTATSAIEANDDVAVLCSAYLESITFGTVDTGLDKLVQIMGPDAPPGVQDALSTLADPEGDIEGYFQAQNTLDGYVLPICNDTFSTSIVPATDDAAAADGFVAAVRDGDLAAGERLAPTNIIAAFDWNGFPNATWEYDPDNATVTMLLEPTVTVFCQVSDGSIEFCAFGE